eukprot:SAG31_NODE_12971_length_903_cov_1.072139_2_plen_37_part_01
MALEKIGSLRVDTEPPTGQGHHGVFQKGTYDLATLNK